MTNQGTLRIVSTILVYSYTLDLKYKHKLKLFLNKYFTMKMHCKTFTSVKIRIEYTVHYMIICNLTDNLTATNCNSMLQWKSQFIIGIKTLTFFFRYLMWMSVYLLFIIYNLFFQVTQHVWSYCYLTGWMLIWNWMK